MNPGSEHHETDASSGHREHVESKFAHFIALIVVVTVILTIFSVWLYQADGTVNLDRSLPKYMKEKTVEKN